jgi:predicted nucleotidyltransferase component of viral defense system
MPVRLDEEDPALLREAIRFTSAETGFIPRLIEKDYFCSVVLEYLAASGAGLIFKGGTCLSKIHGSFYRLSEDLDFSIPTALKSSRADRSRSVTRLRATVNELPERLPGFRIVDPLRGANNSTQYNALVGYESLIDGHVEPVGIEVGVREPNMMDTHEGSSKTALLSPIDRQALVEVYAVRCFSYQEAMAEKLRAALCRSDVAIRDFFDVDHAVRHAGFNTLEPAFLELLRRKIAIPRTGPMDVSAGRMEQLQRQLEAQLRPVLREREFAQFELARAVNTLRAVERELARRR